MMKIRFYLMLEKAKSKEVLCLLNHYLTMYHQADYNLQQELHFIYPPPPHWKSRKQIPSYIETRDLCFPIET